MPHPLLSSLEMLASLAASLQPSSSAPAPGDSVDKGQEKQHEEVETTAADQESKQVNAATKLETLRDFIAQQKLEDLKHQQPPLTFWEQVVVYIYNPEAAQYFGRSFASLLKWIVFHLLFYGSIIGLTLGLAYIHPDISHDAHRLVPHYHGEGSYFGQGNIPLGFLPLNLELRRSLLIAFSPTRNETWADYVDQLTQYVEFEEQHPEAYVDCSQHNLAAELKEGDRLCKVYNKEGKGFGTARGLDSWGPCTPEKGFGYPRGAPCVLLKVNRALTWTPQQITANGDTNMTEFIQNELKYNANHLEVTIPLKPGQNPNVYLEHTHLKPQDRVICISCQGASEFEQEVIGDINYYPISNPAHPTGPCIPLYHFPFMNQPHYQSPFVFVEFASLPGNVTLQVRCTAFNSAINREIGTTQFELLIE